MSEKEIRSNIVRSIALALYEGLGVISGGMQASGQMFMHSVGMPMVQDVAETNQHAIVDASTAAVAEHKNPAVRDRARETVHKNGLSDDQAYLIISAQMQKPQPFDYAQYLHRRSISLNALKDVLHEGMYDEKYKDFYEEMSYQIPSLSDVITFAVHEVYDEKKRKFLDLDAEFPSRFAEEAAKRGLREQDARDYWASHWRLPSAEMGYEMLHRGLISEEDLKNLLAVLDYAPTWRDKLMGISYLVPTRIDIRRLRVSGVYQSKEDVENAYIRLGYDEKDAEALAEMVESEYVQQEKELTKSEILNIYKHNPSKKSWALDQLQALGYSEDDAELLLSIALYKHEQHKRDLSKAETLALYKKGIVSREEAKRDLIKLGYDGSEAEELLKLAEYQAPEDIKLLSFGYLRTLYRRGYIDMEYFASYLYYLGYTKDDITYILEFETDERNAYLSKHPRGG